MNDRPQYWDPNIYHRPTSKRPPKGRGLKVAGLWLLVVGVIGYVGDMHSEALCSSVWGALFGGRRCELVQAAHFGFAMAIVAGVIMLVMGYVVMSKSQP